MMVPGKTHQPMAGPIGNDNVKFINLIIKHALLINTHIPKNGCQY